MSHTSDLRSNEFLKISDQFKLGALTTEASHPATANLSEVAKGDAAAALKLLFEVDADVVKTYREFVVSGRADQIKTEVLRALRNGGNLFFTGCGSTGRLSIQLVSIWRDFWQRQSARGVKSNPSAAEFEQRAFAVMAGGDFALIKAVEGFEDFTVFGKKQIADMGLCSRDVVFAITEGGETSFVIGTAWQGVEAGARVYFVYNNPDDVLCEHVQRSREVLKEPRIEKVNLTTGPMAITGSTRMQATTIQLAVLLTVLEMVLRELMNEFEPGGPVPLASKDVPAQFEQQLTELQAVLKGAEVLTALGRLTTMEEEIYRSGHKNNYFAARFGIDVLTDTTERSPTYCTPPFRKFDDTTATESWAFLFVPCENTEDAWQHIIKRRPQCVEWTDKDVRALVPDESRAARTCEIVRKIRYSELMRFKVGLDGLQYRRLGAGDSAVAIVSEHEKQSLLSTNGFFRVQLEAARKAAAKTGVICFGRKESLFEMRAFLDKWDPDCIAVLVPVPETGFLLEGVTRIAVKTLLNSLSTCTMVRLGRVMGNFMIWVVPSNLKLIDRSTRYIQKLTSLDYPSANRLLFEVLEYVEPRMKADQAYPPVVGVSVLRHRHGLDNKQAEEKLMAAV
jgi:N-acetylmuramic acid 6-phosphate etherase